MSQATAAGRPDGLPRMGSEDPQCDFCGALGHKIPATLVVQVAEVQNPRAAEYFRGCSRHRKQALLACLGTSLKNPRVSYMDMEIEEDAGWVLFEHMDALHLLATL
ncbi:MAG: hypothetical protein HY006_01630 [Candidatus Sungbacteria bacterium]|nr:hypothetical protein [Candidatus Sungbacteria bacterium]